MEEQRHRFSSYTLSLYCIVHLLEDHTYNNVSFCSLRLLRFLCNFSFGTGEGLTHLCKAVGIPVGCCNEVLLLKTHTVIREWLRSGYCSYHHDSFGSCHSKQRCTDGEPEREKTVFNLGWGEVEENTMSLNMNVEYLVML